MNRITAAICAAAVALSLSACDKMTDVDRGKIAGMAGTMTAAVLPAAEMAKLASYCRMAQPALVLASAPTMPAELRDTAVYPQAYCAELLAGQVPPTTDGNTPVWLPTVIAAVGMAAQMAGVTLPM